MKYFVYILECSDGTFYTGITNSLDRRLAMHNAGRGAKYTRGRQPVVLKYFEEVSNRSEALEREWQIKKLKKEGKERLWYNIG
jgi:putative endonuclease